MRRLKYLPLLLMLLVGLIASVMMFYYHYDMVEFLLILVLVMLLFYVAGALIQRRVNWFIQRLEDEEALKQEQEGEVIEKEAVETDSVGENEASEEKNNE